MKKDFLFPLECIYSCEVTNERNLNFDYIFHYINKGLSLIEFFFYYHKYFQAIQIRPLFKFTNLFLIH